MRGADPCVYFPGVGPHFLNTYDPALRKKSGSYYTPTEVVAAMTRLTDQALQKYLSIPEGLSADSVAIIDPAMGTGTYGLSIVQHVAAQAEKYGLGAVADAVTSVAKRLYGIELQSGPFSVAELRLSQAIQEFGGQLPKNGMHLYVADTLEDPESGTNRELSYTLQLGALQAVLGTLTPSRSAFIPQLGHTAWTSWMAFLIPLWKFLLADAFYHNSRSPLWIKRSRISLFLAHLFELTTGLS